VRLDLAKGDSDFFPDTLNESLTRWIAELNTPGAKLPKVWRNFDEAEDLKTRSERDKNLVKKGSMPDVRYLNENYGGSWIRRSLLGSNLIGTSQNLLTAVSRKLREHLY
jgi:hypothetical protein